MSLNKIKTSIDVDFKMNKLQNQKQNIKTNFSSVELLELDKGPVNQENYELTPYEKRKIDNSKKIEGDYVNWKQYDQKWANIPLGNSNIWGIGCLSTCLAIQIARANTTITVDKFNPGVLVQSMSQNGGYTPGGGLIFNNSWNQIAPNFNYVGNKAIGGDISQISSKIKTELDNGYYAIAKVNGPYGEHWVSVLDVENGDVKISDPGFDKNYISEFAGVPEVALFEVTDKLN